MAIWSVATRGRSNFTFSLNVTRKLLAGFREDFETFLDTKIDCFRWGNGHMSLVLVMFFIFLIGTCRYLVLFLRFV